MIRLIVLPVGILLATVHSARAAIDFGRDVRPILEARCHECHDSRKTKADLRLDIRSGLTKGGENGPVVIPGKSLESPLIQRVTATDEDDIMPPKGDRLTSVQIDVLRRWIDEGAVWPDALAGEDPARSHWAFKRPVRPPLPKTDGSNPIDALVAATLEREKLDFSPPASPATLMRRISLDLIGLPPEPADLARLTTDPSPRALERAIDRMLESPHFGEKWARHWLDAARYADSDGFEKDKPRYSVWNYRDWVINAFNRDLPYDQFVIEQLAGDQIPGASQSSTIATGFLRNSMINEEGGVDPEQFRMDAMFDRMDCIGKSVLGLTIQCAQCHNHKYDPISAEEYYRIFAYLNNDHEPEMVVYSPAESQKITRLRSEMGEAAAEATHATPDWADRLKAWEQTVRARPQPQWEVLQGEFEHDSTGGQRYLPQSDGSFLAQGYAPTKHSALMKVKSPLPRITAFRLELLNDPNLPCNGPGRSFKGTCALTEFEVRIPDDSGKLKNVKFTRAVSDFADPPQSPLEANFFDKSDRKRTTGPASDAIDGNNDTAWGIDAGPGRRNQPRVAWLIPEKPIEPVNGELNIVLIQNHGGWNSDDLMTNNLGRFRISATADTPPGGEPLPPLVVAALEVEPGKRSEAQRETILFHWLATVAEGEPVRERMEALWKQWPEGSTQLVLRARETVRPTSILKRGDWLKPSAPVTAGVPAVLHPVPEGAPPTRLTLARWLVSRESPTAARVWVNRVWQQVFGEGLVTTPEDLGVRCDPPAHPQLLDWLAVDFMENGWRLKPLLRRIVTSRTYQQTSRVTPALLERDPGNRWLARGPRFRVDAEVVRDIALAASGVLDERIGGPSMMTPAPLDLFKPPASYAPFPWVNAQGADKYRRALYTFRRRSTPYPAFQTFDAPNGDQSCLRRPRSNTPLQALTTLNEEIFVDCARELGQRMVADGGSTTESRIRWAMMRVLGREPEREEIDELIVLAARQRRRFVDGTLNAAEVATGAKDPVVGLPAGATAADLALSTTLARVLLNLDEAVTKE